MKKATLRDIAALLQTTTKTVSKALNDQPGVSPELRDKIKLTAEELHYVPNIFGRGLSGKPQRTIGVVLPENANPFYSFVIKGLEQEATDADYSIMLCNSNDDLERESKVLRVLIEKHVDGIILTPAQPRANQHIELLQRQKIPYVLINRTIPGHDYPCVKADSAAGALLAGQYLLDKGHRRILHLTRASSVIAVEERIQGLRQAFQERGLNWSPDDLSRTCQEVSVEGGYVAMREILRTRRDFTAVFAFNDMLAFGVMKAILEDGLRIPDEVAVMGFDNVLFSDVCLVPLTTVNQNHIAIGAIAMQVLLDKIHGASSGDYPPVPAPYLVIRRSA
ncbi:transcriptional regulator, LacI family [Candidatus Moduliflexus flocculans]|uniref:Transcriptional regulator, LacI family n=1 Tax=Candidatus Moduliflexus flocculans TaxID=1499966 RepID=A0A0S6VZB1_9BACT|nr:transcriptional regulator, LacI family [Candidatus Moduliflexus flocculans]